MNAPTALLLLERANLDGPLLLAALLVCFVGGVLVTYALMRGSARALYDLVRPKRDETTRDDAEE